ncbi:MAG TPA: VIT domain-containing protein [Telluria sp.]|nr:VIT domain-containing protein [Telluria sp.]
MTESPATARLQTRDGADVVLDNVSVAGAVDGLILGIAVEQRFRNSSERNIEIVYTFPLPGGAVLLGVDVRVGERQLSGAVGEKRQAAQAYEDSLAAGDAAIMLEKNHDHSYSLNLGNLAAGEACVVTLRYAETLLFEQRGLRISVPTVIAPRYGDPVRDGHLASHQVAGHSLSAHSPFSLTLRLSRELAHARIGSPSHAVATQFAGDGVTVSLAQPAALDRDFVLVLDQLPHDSLAIATPDPVAPGHGVVLASFCPRFAAAAPQAVAAKLLVDCSGSMAGDSIAAAKRALHAIVAQFDAGDRFSLSRFGTTVHHRARGLWQASARTRNAASRWVDALHANLGGTEMEDALTSTFALGTAGATDVLLVTDGQIEAIDGVIAAAAASGHRLFIVAIGSSPAESHLRRLALATGGACDFVAAGERVEPAVLRMFARLRSPRLQQLRVRWPAQPAWTCELPEAVFDGDTVNLFAQFAGAVHGEVQLFGRDGDAAEFEIARAALAQNASGETLARMAASARIATPCDRAAALRIALDYQLVTQHTSFLLVHERAEHDKAADMPALRHVAPMVPAGWAGSGSTGAQPAGISRAPAIWRRSAPSDLMVADCEARWDVPAFLRKEDVLSADDDWLYCDSYGGMTPSGLHKLLRALPRAQWPRTYAELRRKGLGVALVDWLDLAVGDAGDERSVIAAFLFVISLDETRAAMLDATGRAPSLGTAALKLIARLPRRAADDAAVDLALADRIAAQLAGMSTTNWPPCVFALEAEAACA